MRRRKTTQSCRWEKCFRERNSKEYFALRTIFWSLSTLEEGEEVRRQLFLMALDSGWRLEASTRIHRQLATGIETLDACFWNRIDFLPRFSCLPFLETWHAILTLHVISAASCRDHSAPCLNSEQREEGGGAFSLLQTWNPMFLFVWCI